jgi:flagellar basal-body rod protein FlgC
MDEISATFSIANSALRAQSQRIRVATENLANADSTGKTPGSNPYTRKVVSFETAMDEATGADLIKADGEEFDTAPYRIENIPGHPAADQNGNVKLPNVNMLVELADIREGTRSYDATVQVMKQARELVNMTLDLMKAS